MSDVTIPEDPAVHAVIPLDVLNIAVDLCRDLALTTTPANVRPIARAILAERGAAKKTLEDANRRATDHRYMVEAYWAMLGPTGRRVAEMWHEKGVKRVHHSWGPDAAAMTGEERAQFILDFEAAARRVVPVDCIDGPEPARATQSSRE